MDENVGRGGRQWKVGELLRQMVVVVISVFGRPAVEGRWTAQADGDDGG